MTVETQTHTLDVETQPIDKLTGWVEAPAEPKEATAPGRTYESYKALGGIINVDDYNHAMNRLTGNLHLTEHTAYLESTILQAQHLADGIRMGLGKREDGSYSPVIELYVILRRDLEEGRVQYHGQLSDQAIFTEVLRMLGYPKAVQAMVERYPTIELVYNHGDKEEQSS